MFFAAIPFCLGVGLKLSLVKNNIYIYIYIASMTFVRLTKRFRSMAI